MKIALLLTIFALTFACGPDESGDTELETEKAVEDALNEDDQNDRLDDLETQKLAEDGSEDSESLIPEQWSLREMDHEIEQCSYEWLSTFKTWKATERFCDCKIEMISTRWDYEDYLRHPFSYDDYLEESGRLERCTEPSKFGQPDENEHIEEDREYKPEETN